MSDPVFNALTAKRSRPCDRFGLPRVEQFFDGISRNSRDAASVRSYPINNFRIEPGGIPTPSGAGVLEHGSTKSERQENLRKTTRPAWFLDCIRLNNGGWEVLTNYFKTADNLANIAF